MEQWEHSSMLAMVQWIMVNKPYIKYCLSIGRRQKQIHSLDIRDYLPIQVQINTQIKKKKERQTSGGYANTGHKLQKKTQQAILQNWGVEQTS
eukprot:13991409-Ditylum_brightwellii.AAC.1